jgi:hypothetical protein
MEFCVHFSQGTSHNKIVVVNGGWTTDSYELSLGEGVGIGHIHSVILWVDTEEFEFHQF